MPENPRRFDWPARVYYEDTDSGGIVYYANYLKFFERARTEWLRAAGVNQQLLAEADGVMFVVKSATIDYHASAKLDDELIVSVMVEKLGRASVQFVQEARRIDGDKRELLTSGRIKVGCIDKSGLRPAQIPNHVMDKIRSME